MNNSNFVRRFSLIAIVLVEGSTGFEQKCYEFGDYSTSANTYDLVQDKSYFRCEINVYLLNECDEVTTNTGLSNQSNDDVTMVSYDGFKTIKCIPYSLFTTFVNVEYLYIGLDNHFETLKPEYLKNAKRLKSLQIFQNSVKKLEGNIFVEAPNLENINFNYNQIESIDLLAFNGLPNLQRIYLHGNKIQNLHSSTFSFISKLSILGLLENNCMDQSFENANQKFSEIEGEISRNCTFA